MPRWLTNIPWLRRLVNLGANRDIRPELLKDGLYSDASNMRPTSVDGNTGGVEAIKGEVLVHPAVAGQGYVCIGATGANNRTMSFWASSLVNQPNAGDNPPCVIIDGLLVAQSINIPYVYDRPLQIAMEERCMGGVAYPADHNADPLYWPIDSLLEELGLGSGLYFDNYTPEVNAVALGAPIEWPKFKGLVSLVSDGASTGQYGMALRFRTQSGDTTNPGPACPFVSVPRFMDTPALNAHPGGRNIGGEPNLLAPTLYGLQYQWRIDNTYGYSEVEVIVARINDGGGLTGVITTEIVARIPIEPGLNTPFTFTYPQDNNIPVELLPADAAVDFVFSIHAPKGVELADNRLSYANFTAGNTTPELVFDEVAGSTTFFLTEKLSTNLINNEVVNDGYANPVHNTYKKSLFRGEKNGWGVMCWGPVADRFPVAPITGAENLQAPNRRDPLNGRAFDYSVEPPIAANTACQSDDPVGYVYEAMGQGSFKKTDVGAGSLINVVNTDNYPYSPWRPVGPADSQRYDTPPNTGRVLSTVGPPLSVDARYNEGSVWAPSHHALGLAVNGITNFPTNTKAFSIMRTPDAGRVICQGIGTYVLTDNPIGPTMPKHKNTSNFLFNSPDLMSGRVPQAILEDMQLNPTQYKFQCVAPLGFYTDIYGYFRNTASIPNDPIIGAYIPPPPLPNFANAANAVDMMSYAGIQHDEGQVNVGEPAAGGMAYQPNPSGNIPAGNYVGYGAWRNTQPPNGQNPPTQDQMDYSFWNQTGNDGNTTIVMQSFTAIAEGRSTTYVIGTDNSVYTPGGIDTRDGGGDYHVDFNSTEVRTFHQPWYIINIIKDGADVPNEPTEYLSCTTVKREGRIGIVTSGTTVTMELINERVDDVLPRFQSEYRYVYVKPVDAPEQHWLCVTNFGAFDTSVILADIAANGFWVAPDGTQVYGVYEVVRDTTGDFVVFGTFGINGTPTPPVGASVTVKYDHTAPVIAFGGSVTVAPAIHAIYDRLWNGPDGTNTAVSTGGLPLPYVGFIRNPFWYQPRDSYHIEGTQYLPIIQSIRQWCVLWDAEARTPGRLNLIGPDGVPQQNSQSAFPNVHYVARPYVFVGDVGGFHGLYLTDYPNENTSLGGIRYTPDINFDYAREEPVTGVGEQVGIDIRTDYCNAIAASLEVDPLVNEQPGTRTFLTSNMTAISQENGEIKVIASALGPNGQNLYAWTQKGVCRILTNKNILTGADGAEVATQSVSNYFGTEQWLSRNIGSPDQMWRLFAKGYAPAGQQYADSFFWADRNGVYRMTGDTIIDISENKYFSQLKEYLLNFPTDYSPQTTAFYNSLYNEVYFSIDPIVFPPRPPLQPLPITLPRKTFVYSAQNNEWLGTFDYDFDAYWQTKQQVYGFRDLQTFGLQSGYTINGETRVASVTVPFVGDLSKFKELETWQVVGTRPDRVEILDADYNVITIQDEATAALVNPAEANYWVLLIDSWQQWASAVLGTDLRPQGPMFYLRVTWNTEGDKECVALGALLRNLK